jgi:hypothetical protein
VGGCVFIFAAAAELTSLGTKCMFLPLRDLLDAKQRYLGELVSLVDATMAKRTESKETSHPNWGTAVRYGYHSIDSAYGSHPVSAPLLRVLTGKPSQVYPRLLQ